MADSFRSHTQNLTAPPTSAAELPPSDSTDLPYVTRGIYVGTAGNLKVRMQDGSLVTFNNVVAGQIYPLRIDRVLATGTTAAGIVGLW